MQLTPDELAQIVTLISSASVTYAEIQIGTVRICVGPEMQSQKSIESTRSAGVSPVQRILDIEGDGASVTIDRSAESLGDESSEERDLVSVEAPMVGIVFVAPAPGREPFCEIGQHVDEGATLALIEAMKVFLAVRAPVSGIVRSRLFENEDFTEFGEQLFLIEPASGQHEESVN